MLNMRSPLVREAARLCCGGGNAKAISGDAKASGVGRAHERAAAVQLGAAMLATGTWREYAAAVAAAARMRIRAQTRFVGW